MVAVLLESVPMQTSSRRFVALAGLGLAAVISGVELDAQRPQLSLPVIVVYDDGAPADVFADAYRPDDRAQADPDSWGISTAAWPG